MGGTNHLMGGTNHLMGGTNHLQSTLLGSRFTMGGTNHHLCDTSKAMGGGNHHRGRRPLQATEGGVVSKDREYETN